MWKNFSSQKRSSRRKHLETCTSCTQCAASPKRVRGPHALNSFQLNYQYKVKQEEWPYDFATQNKQASAELNLCKSHYQYGISRPALEGRLSYIFVLCKNEKVHTAPYIPLNLPLPSRLSPCGSGLASCPRMIKNNITEPPFLFTTTQ